MSTVEYTRCDNPECGRVSPNGPNDSAWDRVMGWASVTVGCDQYDLCPDCAKKALEAVGVSA